MKVIAVTIEYIAGESYQDTVIRAVNAGIIPDSVPFIGRIGAGTTKFICGYFYGGNHQYGNALIMNYNGAMVMVARNNGTWSQRYVAFQ